MDHKRNEEATRKGAAIDGELVPDQLRGTGNALATGLSAATGASRAH